MKRFVEGVDRSQSTLFPERLEDWIGADNPVRVIDVFVDDLDLGELGFDRIELLAIDGSKFKAVNARDKNFTRAKMKRRLERVEESVERYLHQLDSADRQEPSVARATKTGRLKDKIATLKEEMQRLQELEVPMLATPDQQISHDRSRCPLDGDERPGLRHGRL